MCDFADVPAQLLEVVFGQPPHQLARFIRRHSPRGDQLGYLVNYKQKSEFV